MSHCCSATAAHCERYLPALFNVSGRKKDVQRNEGRQKQTWGGLIKACAKIRTKEGKDINAEYEWILQYCHALLVRIVFTACRRIIFYMYTFNGLLVITGKRKYEH